MKCKAAVAWEPKKPLVIEEVEVMGQKRVKFFLKSSHQVSVIPMLSHCQVTTQRVHFRVF